MRLSGSLRGDMVASRERQRTQRAKGKERKCLHGGVHVSVGRLFMFVKMEKIKNGRKPACDVYIRDVEGMCKEWIGDAALLFRDRKTVLYIPQCQCRASAV